MGAASFVRQATKSDFPSAREAFSSLVEECRELNGTSYSGMIGMKSSFKSVSHDPCVTLNEARDLAYDLLEKDKYNDKYGPAWMIECDEGWVFFGVSPE